MQTSALQRGSRSSTNLLNHPKRPPLWWAFLLLVDGKVCFGSNAEDPRRPLGPCLPSTVGLFEKQPAKDCFRPFSVAILADWEIAMLPAAAVVLRVSTTDTNIWSCVRVNRI